jgi:hypothetical protein
VEQITDPTRMRHRVCAAMLVLMAALISACETSSTVSTSPNPVKCLVSLGAAPTVEAGGGAGSLAITTQPECTWDASSSVGWISALTPATGQGTATLSFRIAANDAAASREGMIVVNGEQARVSQRAACFYDVGPSSHSVDAGGGAGSLNVATASECAWTAASEVSWISLSSTTAGNGNGTVSFTVAANQGDARSGAIVVGNQRSTIAQSGLSTSPCNATISPTSQSVAATGGAGTPITVTTGSSCQWTATSSASWITIATGATGAGNGSVTYSVAANAGAARTGTLTIATRVFTVSQAASGAPVPPTPTPPPSSCTYSISPRSRNAPMLGDTDTVSVTTTSGCGWTAASDVPWITVVSGATGTGNGTVGYLVLPNIGASRTGTITIAGQTFTVAQAALLCSYSISPNNLDVGSAAGTGSTSVSTSSTCTWTAASNDSWITVTSGASGTGNGTVTFSYTANPGDRDRRGRITIAGRQFELEQDRGNRDDDDDDD